MKTLILMSIVLGAAISGCSTAGGKPWQERICEKRKISDPDACDKYHRTRLQEINWGRSENET